MVLLSLSGLTLVGASIAQLVRRNSRVQIKRLLREVFDLADIEVKVTKDKILRPHVRRIRAVGYGFIASVELPKGYPVEKFREKLPVIEQATASKILMKHLRGRLVELQMGTLPVEERMDYTTGLMTPGRPTVPYYTAFGLKQIDFWDEACCHIIVAGATRMGKTVFLRLMFTNILLAMDGNVQFFYINNKVEDYYPMKGVPQIPEPAEDLPQALGTVSRALDAIQERKKILRASKDCVNIKQFRERHPETVVPPMFVVFDEFGRFTDEDKSNELAKRLQVLVTEIAETAGYLDVHLVIATQRPDATTVLKPRIRANILTRVCFQTADEKNSEIVVHTGDAAHLDQIKGRAVVLDGMPQVGQIPYVSEDQTELLLSPYRRADSDVTQPEGQDDSEVPSALPSFVTGAIGEVDLPRGGEAIRDDQPHHETPRPRRSRNNRSKTKGRVLPLHAESDDYTSRVE